MHLRRRIRQGVHAGLPAPRAAALHAAAHHVAPAQQVQSKDQEWREVPRASHGGARGFCDPLDGRADLRVHRLLPAQTR